MYTQSASRPTGWFIFFNKSRTEFTVHACAEVFSFNARLRRCDGHSTKPTSNKFVTSLFLAQLYPTNARILPVLFPKNWSPQRN